MKQLIKLEPEVASEAAAGSSLHQVIAEDYLTLVEVLGEPTYYDYPTHDKVQVEWDFMTPWGVATLYDYKTYQNPIDIKRWSVGAIDDKAAQYLVDFISERRAGL